MEPQSFQDVVNMFNQIQQQNQQLRDDIQQQLQEQNQQLREDMQQHKLKMQKQREEFQLKMQQQRKEHELRMQQLQRERQQRREERLNKKAKEQSRFRRISRVPSVVSKEKVSPLPVKEISQIPFDDSKVKEVVCVVNQPSDVHIESINSAKVEPLLMQDIVVSDIMELPAEVENSFSVFPDSYDKDSNSPQNVDSEVECPVMCVKEQCISPVHVESDVVILVEEMISNVVSKIDQEQQIDGPVVQFNGCSSVPVVSVNQLSHEEPTVKDDIGCDSSVVSIVQLAMSNAMVASGTLIPLSYCAVLGQIMEEHVVLSLSQLEVVSFLYCKMMVEKLSVCFKELVLCDEHGPGPPIAKSVCLFQF